MSKNKEHSKDEPPPVKSSGDPALDNFREQCLDAHNRHRTTHASPGLRMDDTLNEMAQKWAEHLCEKGELSHSEKATREIDGEYVGESCASKTLSSDNPNNIVNHVFSGKDCVDQWYEEHSKYDFSTPGHQDNCGHFTQMVWKNTRGLGVGMVRKLKDNTVNYYIVMNYLPGGNIACAEEYESNVLQPTSQKNSP